jgi:hypothetical protein
MSHSRVSIFWGISRCSPSIDGADSQTVQNISGGGVLPAMKTPAAINFISKLCPKYLLRLCRLFWLTIFTSDVSSDYQTLTTFVASTSQPAILVFIFAVMSLNPM